MLDILKVLNHKFVPNNCTISKCGTKNCKTCKILITDNSWLKEISPYVHEIRHIVSYDGSAAVRQSYNLVSSSWWGNQRRVEKKKPDTDPLLNNGATSVTCNDTLTFQTITCPVYESPNSREHRLQRSISPGLSTPISSETGGTLDQTAGNCSPMWMYTDHIESIAHSWK